MKKFNFKALLVVLLVLVLAFAIVACDKDKNNENNNNNNNDNNPSNPSGTVTPTGDEITSNDFFTELWDRSASIGNSGTIGKSKNFYAHANLELGIGLMKAITNPVPTDQILRLGFDIEAVLDRETANSTGTQAKIRLYSGDTDVCALYFFMKDPTNLYIDFDGQSIKFSAALIDGEDTLNGKLGTLLANFLKKTNQPAGTADETPATGTSFNDTIDSILDGMGEGWTLNTLIGKVLQMANLDLKTLISGNQLVSSIVTALVGDVNSVFDATGNLDVAKVLGAESLAGFFTATKSGDQYTLKSTPDLGNTIGSLLNLNFDLGIDFEADGEDGFKNGVTIQAGFPGMNYMTKLDGTDTRVYPYVELGIRNFEVAPATGHNVSLANAKAEYTDEVAFEMVEKLDFEGFKIKAGALDDFIPDVTGGAIEDIELALQGKVDLSGATPNKTQAKAWLKYGTKNLLEASFVNGRLAVKADQTVAIAGVPVLDTVLELAGPQIFDLVKNGLFKGNAQDPNLLGFANVFFENKTEHTGLNPNFQGALFEGIDVHALLNDFILSKLNTTPAPSTGTATTSEETPQKAPMRKFDVAFLSDMIKKFAPFISELKDGKLTIKSDNLMKDICDIVNMMFDLPYKVKGDIIEDAWTVKNSILNVAAIPMFGTIADYLDEAIDTTGLGLMTEDAAKALLGKTTTLTSAELWAARLLNSLSVEATIDLTQGIGWSVKAAIGSNVSLTYTSSMGMLADGKTFSVTDLAAGVQANAENWIYMNLAPTPAA